MSGWSRRRRNIFHSNSLWFSLILGIGAALLFIHQVNGRIRPIMIDLGSAQINNEVVSLLHKAVEEAPLPYEQVVSLEKDAQGRVTLLKSDMNAVSAYRSKLVKQLIDSVDELQARKVSVPLGSLTGIELLSGRGPGIPVKVLSIGVVQSEFENLFTSAGINQTRHQIMLNITVDTKIVMPGINNNTKVNTQICIAETVIVGTVPEHFTYLGETELN